MVMHLYEVRPRRDKRGFDLISHALPFGRTRAKNEKHCGLDTGCPESIHFSTSI